MLFDEGGGGPLTEGPPGIGGRGGIPPGGIGSVVVVVVVVVWVVSVVVVVPGVWEAAPGGGLGLGSDSCIWELTRNILPALIALTKTELTRFIGISGTENVLAHPSSIFLAAN